MPFTKISLAKGNNKTFLKKLKEEVLKSVVDALEISSDEKNIFIMEYEEELFEMKKPYKYLIEITMYSGRTDEKKKQLFDTIVEKLYNKLSIEKESILIFINEQPPSNWKL